MKNSLAFAALSVGLIMSANAQTPDKDLSDIYPLDRCPVSNTDLSILEKPITRDYGGRQVEFCCAKCPKEFGKNLSENLKKLDEAIITRQKPLYPLDTCVVSGKLLDGPDVTVVDLVYKNRLVRFCCESCVRQFTQDPQPFLKTLDTQLIVRAKESYPLDLCIVSGDPLSVPGHHQVDAVIGYRLIRVCGKECLLHVLRNPSRVFARLENAKAGELPFEGFEGKHTRESRRQKTRQ